MFIFARVLVFVHIMKIVPLLLSIIPFPRSLPDPECYTDLYIHIEHH